MKDQLYAETTPLFYKLDKKVKFDESTASTFIQSFQPSTGNNIQSLNTSCDITMTSPGVETVIQYCGSELSGIRTRIQYSTGYGAANSINTVTATGNINSNADITFDPTFWGQLFNKMELTVGTTVVETISPFEPYYELMCHLHPLDFKYMSGARIGYIPDEITGMASDQKTITYNAGLTLASTAAVASGASGIFNIVQTNTTAGALAINIGTAITATGNSVITTNYYGQALSFSSLSTVAANATGQFYLIFTAPIALTVGQTYNYFITPSIVFVLSAVNNTVAGVANFYQIVHTPHIATAAAVAATTPVVGSHTVLSNTVTNPYYDPGYEKRKKLYNYPTIGTFRTIELFVPLKMISGFFRDFNRATRNLTITVRLFRNQTAKYKAIFGAPGTDMDIQIQTMQLELLQVNPNDELRTEFNEESMKSIEIGYLAGNVQMIPLPANNSQLSIQLNFNSKPDYMFVMCKDSVSMAAPNSQTNEAINYNLDMQNLQVQMDGNFYPNQPQQANFSANLFEAFYRSWKLCSEAIYRECVLPMQVYRDVYTIFAFDLTAQKIKTKNTQSALTLIGTRNNPVIPSPGDVRNQVNMYVISLQERFYKADFKSQMLIQQS